MEQVSPWILIAFNIVLGLASLFGSMWLRRMEADMRAMQATQQAQQTAINDKLAEKVGKEDFREFRQELRDNFQRVFDGMETLRDRIAEKADRS